NDSLSGGDRPLPTDSVCRTKSCRTSCTAPTTCPHTLSSGIYRTENFKASAATTVYSAEEE
ncbi:hypothetical protein LJC21_00165, partial [Bacteroides sp. OttesenSCG-928-E20]|nr:hypothetical protein [Bacteroides sp. OttesenSCG-928-E20]MDL2305036.1 hypothetical protein [Bacteroides sp. OttesenSCG-928-D19]